MSALLSAPVTAQDATSPAASDAKPATAPAEDTAASPVRRIGGSVSAPTLVHTVTPQFSDLARKEKVGGVVLVTLIVDANGQPQNVHILRGVGMGLDDKAIEAVKQYKFRPAMENGKPVAVQLNVEVHFQFFETPKVLHSVPLELSDEARQAHASGAIVVAFTVDPHGDPLNIHVVQGVGMGMDDRAVQAIRQYKFEPFVEDGQPVAKAATLELKFDAK